MGPRFVPRAIRFRTLAQTCRPCSGEAVFPRLRPGRRPVGENGREPAKAVYDDRKDSPACNASDRHGRVEPSLARCDGTSTASLAWQETIQVALRHTTRAGEPDSFSSPGVFAFR